MNRRDFNRSLVIGGMSALLPFSYNEKNREELLFAEYFIPEGSILIHKKYDLIGRKDMCKFIIKDDNDEFYIPYMIKWGRGWSPQEAQIDFAEKLNKWCLENYNIHHKDCNNSQNINLIIFKQPRQVMYGRPNFSEHINKKLSKLLPNIPPYSCWAEFGIISA